MKTAERKVRRMENFFRAITLTLTEVYAAFLVGTSTIYFLHDVMETISMIFDSIG